MTINTSVLCLSGWGQRDDSLEFLFKEKVFRSLNIKSFSFDYASYSSFQEISCAIKQNSINPDIAIGWSLGAQILVRLISDNIIKPKLLILIAPPFQMVKNDSKSIEIFNTFYQDFVQNPNKTLRRFANLIATNDEHSGLVAKHCLLDSQNSENTKIWLEELGRFSCKNLNFKEFPVCLYFHGSCDMVVDVSQSEDFRVIPNIDMVIFEQCGHAPHISKKELVINKISSIMNLSL